MGLQNDLPGEKSGVLELSSHSSSLSSHSSSLSKRDACA